MKHIMISLLILSLAIGQTGGFESVEGVPEALGTWHNLYAKCNAPVDHFYLNSDPEYAFRQIDYAIENPFDFRSNFHLRVAKNEFGLNVWDDLNNFYSFHEYRIDMENDGIWEQNWTTDELTELVYDYPPVWDGYEQHTLRMQIRFSSILGEIFTVNQYFSINVFPDPQVFTDTAGNMLVQVPSGSCGQRKPILIVEGFDPLNKNYPSLYYNKVFDFLEDDLPQDEFIPFILNFQDGGADMRDNAQVVLDALESTAGLCPDSPLYLIGVSMGGVICRYALAEAEENGIDHRTSVFVSMDAPQQGANINYSLQEVIYQLEPEISEFVARCQEMLSSPAARQLLRQNIYDPPTLNGHGYEFNSFYDELNLLNGDGYPHQTVNLAVSNGAMTASYGSDMLTEPLVSMDAEALELAEMYANILSSAEDAGPGSLMENFKGTYWTLKEYLWINVIDFELVRHFDPVFIPTFSALDLRGVVFDGLDIASYDSSGFQNLIYQESGCYHGEFTELTRAGILEILLNTPTRVRVTNILDGEGVDGSQLQIIETGEIVSSGDTVILTVGHEYTIQPVEFEVPERQVMLNCWNHDPDILETRHTFLTDFATEPQQAVFADYVRMLFDDEMDNSYYIRNPWCVSNMNCSMPPFDHISDTEGDYLAYDVFMYQPDNLDLALPDYYLSTDALLHDPQLNLDYRFSSWGAFNPDHSPCPEGLLTFGNSSNPEECGVQFSPELVDYPGVYIKPDYEHKIMVIFGSPLQTHIVLEDPWHFDSGSQNFEFAEVELHNEAYPVFQDQYTIKAPGLICENGELHSFSHWIGSQVEIEDPDQRVTHIVFQGENASIEAVYNTETVILSESLNWVIPEDDWLEIEPGTVLAFADQSNLTIAGELDISGSESQPVIIQGADVTLSVFGTAILEFVEWDNFEGIDVQYTAFSGDFQVRSSTLTNGGSISVDGPDVPVPHFHDCQLENLESVSVIRGGHLEFSECEIDNVAEGISVLSGSRLIFTDTEMNSESVWAVNADESCVYLNQSSIRTLQNGVQFTGQGVLSLSHSKIQGADQYGFGLLLQTGRLAADYSEISGFCSGASIDVSDGLYQTASRLHHCTLAHNNTGFIWNALPADDHNHFPNEFNVDHTILTSFQNPYTAQNLGGDWLYNYPTIIGDGLDPMYQDPDNGNYTLQWGSPCIDAGDSDLYEIDNTEPDLGAYPYHQMLGDIIPDGEINILDITSVVDYLQGNVPLTENQIHCADTNYDGAVDILDIVIIADCAVVSCSYIGDVYLSNSNQSVRISSNIEETLSRSDDETVVIAMESESDIRGFQFEIEYDSESTILDSAALTPASSGFLLRTCETDPGVLDVLVYPVDDFQIPSGEHDVLELTFTGLERSSFSGKIDVKKPVVSGNRGLPLNILGMDPVIPETAELSAPFPNPFNPATRIAFSLPADGKISLAVYDLRGRLIAEIIPDGSWYPAGNHNIMLNGSGMASGMYFIQLSTESDVCSRKVLLLK